MRSASVALTVALMAIVAGSALLTTGCGGGNEEGGGGVVVTGGTVSGTIIAATENVGLGGVQVDIGTNTLINGQVQFVSAASAISTTPNGDFSITGIPAGTYSTLRITPNVDIWPQQDVNVRRITVIEGQTIALGRILVFDDLPPSPVG